MDIQNLVIANHHINLIRAMKDYHIRHYIWEIAKVLIPVVITGIITVIVMRANDNRNKKRWLNEGHLKRKVDLEIQIRKFLLGIKVNASDEYEVLANLYSTKNRIELEDIDSRMIYNFNKDFETLSAYLANEENERNSNIYEDKSIFALMDEYVCYAPKIQHLFDDFKSFCAEISSLKTIYENGDSTSSPNIIYGDVKELIRNKSEYFERMVNSYLCFQVVVERIIKKLTVSKIAK